MSPYVRWFEDFNKIRQTRVLTENQQICQASTAHIAPRVSTRCQKRPSSSHKEQATVEPSWPTDPTLPRQIWIAVMPSKLAPSQ